MKKNAPKGTLKRCLKAVSQYKLLVALSLLFAAAEVFFTLYTPLLFGRAIDGIVTAAKEGMAAIDATLIRTAALTALCAVASWLTASLNNRMTCRTVQKLRDDLYGKLNTLLHNRKTAYKQGVGTTANAARHLLSTIGR